MTYSHTPVKPGQQAIAKPHSAVSRIINNEQRRKDDVDLPGAVLRLHRATWSASKCWQQTTSGIL